MKRFGEYSIIPFETTPDGNEIQMISLSAPSGMTLDILTLGGTVHRLLVPSAGGKLSDIVLGKDALPEYLSSGYCNSSIIGRYANRISNASYIDCGRKIELEANFGAHSIHGGGGCYATKAMSPRLYQTANQICLELTLLDSGQGGFPGYLNFSVCYCLGNGSITIEYKAVATDRTPWNPTSHVYFDLNGHGKGIREDHELQIFADEYLPSTIEGIPTGEVRSVENTDFDFRNFRNLRTALQGRDAQITQFGGFDHNFCIRGVGLRKAAALKGMQSGINMEVWSDRPGLQLFTLNNLESPVRGKDGQIYHSHDGICLETQHYPDSVNQPSFPSAIISEKRSHQTVTQFVFY